MIKIIIADDESIIRQGLAKSVDWSEYNMELVGLAESGEEAVEMIDALNPMVIFTDICMPSGDGFSIIDYVRENHPEKYIVIISGYDDFKYAQKAIEKGVHSYLLKPFEIFELEDILKKIQMSIHENEVKISDESFSASLYGKELIQKIDEKRLYQCVLLKLCGYKLAKRKFTNEEFHKYYQDYIYMVNKKLAEFKFVKSVRVNSGETYILLESKDYDKAGDHYERLISKLVDTDDSDPSMQYIVCTGNVYKGSAGVRESYENCKDAEKYTFLLGNQQIIEYKSLTKYTKTIHADWTLNVNNFTHCIKTFDKDYIKESLKEVIKGIVQSGEKSEVLWQILIANAYNIIVEELRNYNIKITDIFENPYDKYNEIANNQNLDVATQDFEQLVYEVCTYANNQKAALKNPVIEKAKQFIYDNSCDTTLSLNRVSEHVNMSSCYFSILFKQSVNKSFINYLTDIRISNAKDLLIYTGKKTNEISQSVGYDNSTYFSTLFKKNTGFTPTEFRTINASGE